MSKRGKVMSILVMCLLFFISCEKIDSFLNTKNTKGFYLFGIFYKKIFILSCYYFYALIFEDFSAYID